MNPEAISWAFLFFCLVSGSADALQSCKDASFTQCGLCTSSASILTPCSIQCCCVRFSGVGHACFIKAFGVKTMWLIMDCSAAALLTSNTMSDWCSVAEQEKLCLIFWTTSSFSITEGRIRCGTGALVCRKGPGQQSCIRHRHRILWTKWQAIVLPSSAASCLRSLVCHSYLDVLHTTMSELRNQAFHLSMLLSPLRVHFCSLSCSGNCMINHHR